MSDNLKNGMINGSHVISALENFPRDKVYSEEEIAEMKATDEEAESKFSIDRALLRNLLIRQAILKTPPRYPGLDLIIPVLMKRPGSLGTGEEGIFGYIGLQFKSTYESESVVLKEMIPSLHLVRCGAHLNSANVNCPSCKISSEEMEFVHNNHLLLYMCASYVEPIQTVENVETGETVEAAMIVDPIQTVENVQIVGADPLPNRRIKRRATNNDGMMRIATSESDNILVPYHVTKSLSELANGSKVVDENCSKLIQNIIHAHCNPFKIAESFLHRHVADTVLTMSPLRYSSEDSSIRKERGLQPLNDPLLMKDGGIQSNYNAVAGYINSSADKSPKTIDYDLPTIGGTN